MLVAFPDTRYSRPRLTSPIWALASMSGSGEIGTRSDCLRVLGQLGLCQLMLQLIPPPARDACAGVRKPRSLAAARHVLVRRFSNTGLGFMRWGLSAISSPQVRSSSSAAGWWLELLRARIRELPDAPHGLKLL